MQPLQNMAKDKYNLEKETQMDLKEKCESFRANTFNRRRIRKGCKELKRFGYEPKHL